MSYIWNIIHSIYLLRIYFLIRSVPGVTLHNQLVLKKFRRRLLYPVN